jgi:glycosyltransferase involved in cell wall biosynthesis
VGYGLIFSLLVPYYRQPRMLREQIRLWNAYPEGVQIILVDDGSPEPALPIVEECASGWLKQRLSVYRIGIDVPWNRGGARNLATKEAATDWIVHVDIDHVLTGDCAKRLLDFTPDPKRWYRFERYRNGKADDTRKKDKIPPFLDYGKIHPHIDSYLCTKEAYWKAGGYNEDFSGCLGGGSPFLALMESTNGPSAMLPSDISLQVYTRSVVADSSDHTLSRDRGEFSRRKATLKKPYRGHNPIRFPWTKCTLA